MTVNTLDTETIDGTMTIRIFGALDAETAFHLDQIVDDRTSEASRGFVVDLSDAVFLDSAGVGFLVRLRGRAMAASLSLRLPGASGQPLRLLTQIGGTDTLEL